MTSITNNTLSYLAFNKSLQPNIISTVSTGHLVVVNTAACKLLGYSKKELLTKSRAAIFDINESNFKKMLKQRKVGGKSKAFITVTNKNGKLIPCEITSAVFMDGDGVEKAVTSIADMRQNILKQKNIDTEKEKIVADNIILAQVKSNDKQTENKKWKKYAGKSSYDVMWDWELATGEIYIGDSVKEVFGYKILNNIVHFKDFSECLLPEEKSVVNKRLLQTLASGKKNWKDSFKIKRFDGSIAFTICRANILRNEKGKAIQLIGAIQDVSKLKNLEKKLTDQIALQKEQREIFPVASNISFDGIWDWNIPANTFFLGDAFEEMFGYHLTGNQGNMTTDWINHIHPDDKKSVEKNLQNAIVSSAHHWEYLYRFIKADNAIAKVFNRATIIRDEEGKAYRIIGAMQDIGKIKALEEELEQVIGMKDKQIEEAREDAKEMERSDIGKELHDNINQLLFASRMYIERAKRGGENSGIYLARSSEYILNAIEEIRKLSKRLTTNIIQDFGLCETIENFTRDMMEMNPVKISCVCTMESFIENSVDDKFKLNILRIVQEQINNILKHSGATEVTINLTQDKRFIILHISDNGIGFDTGKKQKGIGIGNIKSRATSNKGVAKFTSQPGKGCILEVAFPF